MGVSEVNGAVEHTLSKVEFLPVGQELHGPRVKPLLPGDAEGQRQPVRQVDQILVFDLMPVDLGPDRLYPPAR